ncbi:STAS domain-containing protein [Micromonospora sp. CPCC 205371]|nr:STAS domain-containing protein [Micromonospora sp. CPCC 205371]
MTATREVMVSDMAGPRTRLTVTVERDGGRVRVVVVGEVDFTTADVFSTRLDAAVEEASPAIVVDLRGVSHIDSTGLSALVRAHNRAVTTGHTITVAGLQLRVRRVLEVTGLLPGVINEELAAP